MPKAAATQPGLVDRIAHDIQSGVYRAGAWLKQIDLQERYDCTRLEVRRALDQLTAKRLIAHIPNRGYHVYAMDPDVHGQIRDIRILLETGAAADLMPNVTSAKVRALRALAERFAKCCRTARCWNSTRSTWPSTRRCTTCAATANWSR